MNNLLLQLTSSYPDIIFRKGDHFSWSAARKTVTFKEGESSGATWNLLHEVGHAILGHTAYQSDMELLKKEVAAWEQAQAIASTYGVVIEGDHIEDCLDSYRDWIFKRSTCPSCRVQGIQKDPGQYSCLNCKNSWLVTKSRFCRPYRRSK